MEDKGRLVLTLCKSDAQGSYHHVIIPLPKSYEAAVNDARRVFRPYIRNKQLQASDVVLKCAIKRANGTGAWAILQPADWSSVIRSDGDEVGVFIRQDSLNLPYEPIGSGVTNAGANMQLRPKVLQYNDPAHTSGIQVEKKIMYLILKTEVMYPGNEKSTMIEVPATYEECQAEAYKVFKSDLEYGAKPSQVVLQSKRVNAERRFGPLGDSWSVVTPAAYKPLISTTSGNRIDMYVVGKSEMPYWD